MTLLIDIIKVDFLNLNKIKISYKTDQENLWASDFCQGYIDRNNSEKKLNSKIVIWSKMLQSTHDVKSIRELGCGQGLNLVALKTLLPHLQLSGYEINQKAAQKQRAEESQKLNKVLSWKKSMTKKLI